jgi:hypothetical protein
VRSKQKGIALALSPVSLAIVGALLIAARLAADAAGWREEVRFLSGTNAVQDAGARYVVATGLALFVAPILLIGSGIMAIVMWAKENNARR